MSISKHVWNGIKPTKKKWEERQQNKPNCKIYITTPGDYDNIYGLCGAYGNCRITDSRVCLCLIGFNPKSPQNSSQGCVRNKPY